MAMKPESVFRKKVRQDLRDLSRRYPIFFEAIQQRAICGSPDFVLCIRGDFIALELKSSFAESPTKLQDKKLEQIGKAGGIATPVNPGNWPDVLELLEQLAKGDDDGVDEKTTAETKATDQIAYCEGHHASVGGKILKH